MKINEGLQILSRTDAPNFLREKLEGIIEDLMLNWIFTVSFS